MSSVQIAQLTTDELIHYAGLLKDGDADLMLWVNELAARLATTYDIVEKRN